MTLVPQQTEKNLPSLDYIAGIVSCHGNFGWTPRGKNSSPFFQIKIHQSETDLLKLIKTKLGLKEKIYKYNHNGRKYSMIKIHRKQILEGVIIPTFNFRLFGKKQRQFEQWQKQSYQFWLSKLYS
jgi:hypothetical protein